MRRLSEQAFWVTFWKCTAGRTAPGGGGSRGLNDRVGALKYPTTSTGTCGLAVPPGAPTTLPTTPLPGVASGILGLGPSVTWAVTS